MEAHGVQVIDLNLPECIKIMEDFIQEKPELWNEDIMELQSGMRQNADHLQLASYLLTTA